MEAEAEHRYTITELADASAAALDSLGIAARNGQVRDRPDARTIRYYAALGLVGRPAEMNGRTAIYGDRHLLQVLAVKALQARGATLADVQRTLVGASEPELRAAVGPGLAGALAAAGEPAQPARPNRPFGRMPPLAPPDGPFGRMPPPARPDGPFWQVPPRAPATAAAEAASPAAPMPPVHEVVRPGATVMLSASEPADQPPTAGPGGVTDDPMRPRRLTAVPLAEGATLLIEHADGEAVDAGALRAAAAPLLAQLTDAGLLPGEPTHRGATQ